MYVPVKFVIEALFKSIDARFKVSNEAVVPVNVVIVALLKVEFSTVKFSNVASVVIMFEPVYKEECIVVPVMLVDVK